MPGERIDAQEALDALAAFGPFDSTQKQMWRADHYDQWCELEHPTRTTFADADGNPVSVDDTRPETMRGARVVPATVVVTASRVDDYIAKGFRIPAPAVEAFSEPKPRRSPAKAKAKAEEAASADAADNGDPKQ